MNPDDLIDVNPEDVLLYELSDGDVLKKSKIENLLYEDCLEYYYLKRVEKVNNILLNIQRLKKKD